jgi:aryl-alcohol dehydrogenase-like predicted oxidoreductase
MEYSRLGNTGLLVSRLAFGNMVNYAPEDEETNVEIIKTLYEAGVNFFDSAEAYDLLLI